MDWKIYVLEIDQGKKENSRGNGLHVPGLLRAHITQQRQHIY